MNSNSVQKRCNVLIVDDIPRNIQVAANILQKEGYRLFFAQDGQTALEQIKTNSFDLILLDIMMPGMDGFQVCQQLKKDDHPKTSRIPIIFLTAKSEQEDIIKGFELGAVDYVTKPFNGVELLARVKTHLALKSYQEELEGLNATKDKFFSILAHDLRDPVQSVTLGMEMLKLNYHKFDQQKQLNYIDRMCKSTSHLSHFLDKLLEWARAQQKTISFQPESIDLGQLIENCVKLLEETAAAKSINISSRVTGNQQVFVDANMIETVLRNLISNAVKFTANGGEVSVALDEREDTIGMVVTDTGVGIPQEEIAKLLNPEHLVSTLGTANEKGTGLGLLLCKEFVQKNNGTMEINSQPNKGSRFAVYLPRP